MVLYETSWSLLLSLSALKQVFENAFLINFISTYSKLLKYFILARFPLIEDYKQRALSKDLIVAPFVERFKTATLRKTSW